MMKLYFSKGACSLVVRIILNELKLQAEYESVNLKTKETAHGKNFFDINPKGAVPVLELDDKSILTENVAILYYLAESNQANQLLPSSGNKERYRVMEALNFISTELHKGCAPFFNPAMPQQVKEEIFKPQLLKKLKWVDENLAKNDYFVGNQFTLADPYLFVILTWLPVVGIKLSDFESLTKYYKTIKNRASIKKSLEEEGLL